MGFEHNNPEHYTNYLVNCIFSRIFDLRYLTVVYFPSYYSYDKITTMIITLLSRHKSKVQWNYLWL